LRRNNSPNPDPKQLPGENQNLADSVRKNSELEMRLAEAEATVQALISSQVDAVIDRNSATPLLLRQTQQALEEERQRLLVLSREERSQRLFAESLAKAALAVNSSLDLDFVLDRILDEIHSVIPFDAGVIALLDRDHVVITRVHGFEDQPEAKAAFWGSFPLQDFPIWQKALSSHATIREGDVRETKEWIFLPGLEWIRSVLITSLYRGDSIIGFLHLFSAEINYYDQESANRLDAYTGQAAVAIQNASLYHDLESALQKEQSMRNQVIMAEKFSAMGRMLGSIAHELNNPLQTIKNCLYLARQDIPADSPVQDYLSMSFSEITRLSKLVGQLRETYRPQEEIPSHPCDLQEILEEVHNIMLPHLMNQNVQWIMTKPSRSNSVQCNPDHIKQVFINIIMNAIEAMQPNGGSLQVLWRFSPDDKKVGAAFKDSGPGIAPEVLPNLFEPFVTTKTSGLGLGLSICYDLIQKYDGTIEVETALGNGSTFTVWLPGIN
jgi:signal transduction histidine kinase